MAGESGGAGAAADSGLIVGDCGREDAGGTRPAELVTPSPPHPWSASDALPKPRCSPETDANVIREREPDAASSTSASITSHSASIRDLFSGTPARNRHLLSVGKKCGECEELTIPTACPSRLC